MYKILVIETASVGSSKYRLQDPNYKLLTTDEDFKIDFAPINKPNVFFQDLYDMIIIHSSTFNTPDLKSTIKTLQKAGTKFVLDIDDYWVYDKHHQLYSLMKSLQSKFMDIVMQVDAVTVSTEYLRLKVKPYNKNVYVLKNAVDLKHRQYKPYKVESEKVRIGWIGGSTHLKDLEMLRKMIFSLSKSSLNYQMILGGFTNKAKDKKGNISKLQKPEYWAKVEHIFTNEYRLKDKQYLLHLLEYNEGTYHNEIEQEYRRFWSRDISNYANMYDEIDISLAPLLVSEFNNAKSELKLIEAGAKKCAVVASNLTPYNSVATHGVDAFLVNGNVNKNDWYKYVYMLAKDKSLREDMALKLHELVCNEYDLNKTVVLRKEVYLDILGA